MPDKGYLFSEIAALTGGSLSGSFTDNRIEEILTDSRKLSTPQQTAFFALVSPRNNGHRFIADLYKRGVRYFLVSSLPAQKFEGAGFILVDDTLKALQDIAAYHRSVFDLPVIGITGSNGKTIVKEWLWQLLSPEKTIVRSPRSYNSQIGVPLSVWQIRNIHNLAIFEAGISQPGEMGKLARVIKPDIGILTNIGHAHDQFFASHQQKLEEKLLLFQEAETLIYCSDDTLVDSLLSGIDNQRTKLFDWGYREGNKLRITEVNTSGSGTQIDAIFEGRSISIEIPFTDAASVENSIHCWCVMLLLGFGPVVTSERMQQLHPVEMRLQMNAGINGCSVINDAYSFDPDSLQIALDFMMQQNQHDAKCLILSDMRQGELNEPLLYRKIAGMVNAKNIHRMIGIGETIAVYGDLFQAKAVFFKDTESFLRQFKSADFSNESILIKGARDFGFERITSLLMQKSHETILEVNLDALVHNLNFYRSRLKPGTRLMAMVKAFSYGSGSYEIANTLQFHRADYLAVAYADEGVELRKAGISLPIMVMNPEESGMGAILVHDLEPEIYNFRTLQMLITAIKRFRVGEEPVKIHLKFDTGMHRLGFAADKLPELTKILLNHPEIRVESVFSHLVGSDNETFDDYTSQQISGFASIAEQLRESLGYDFMRHILNSAGILRFPEAQFEMVRLGISLYGISSDQKEQSQLETVTSLKTSISQITHVGKNESVGYSRSWKAQRDSVIATIPIGYADGLSRRLGNGTGHFLVNGNIVPVAGNVCMDMTMLDITGIDAKEGDDVLVFGRELPINRLAEEMDTIPYEILTGISARVKRAYFKE
jgi:alanine racemase